MVVFRKAVLGKYRTEAESHCKGLRHVLQMDSGDAVRRALALNLTGLRISGGIGSGGNATSVNEHFQKDGREGMLWNEQNRGLCGGCRVKKRNQH